MHLPIEMGKNPYYIGFQFYYGYTKCKGLLVRFKFFASTENLGLVQVWFSYSLFSV